MSDKTLGLEDLPAYHGLNDVQTESGRAHQPSLMISWARHQDEIEEAQRLRYKVFVEEMGAVLPKAKAGLDQDLFDNWCDHLIVRDEETLRVVGTYRVLTPHKAAKLGSLYSESEFDLTRLAHLRPKMIELGRSCVHQDYRTGSVIMALWGGLGRYMLQGGYETMLGCASVSWPMAATMQQACTGSLAKAIWPPSNIAPSHVWRCRSKASTSSWQRNRRRSSKATCGLVPKSVALRPGTRTSTPPTF